MPFKYESLQLYNLPGIYEHALTVLDGPPPLRFFHSVRSVLSTTSRLVAIDIAVSVLQPPALAQLRPAPPSDSTASSGRFHW